MMYISEEEKEAINKREFVDAHSFYENDQETGRRKLVSLSLHFNDDKDYLGKTVVQKFEYSEAEKVEMLNDDNGNSFLLKKTTKYDSNRNESQVIDWSLQNGRIVREIYINRNGKCDNLFATLVSSLEESSFLSEFCTALKTSTNVVANKTEK